MKRLLVLSMLLLAPIVAAQPAGAQQWVASWTGSAHGPYPIGNPTAQLELKFAFPAAEQGARDQSFRLIVRPDIWGQQTRVRLSNVFGKKPVTFDDAYVGLQESGSAIVTGTNQPLKFKGQKSVTVAPGDSVMSDPVALPFVKAPAGPTPGFVQLFNGKDLTGWQGLDGYWSVKDGVIDGSFDFGFWQEIDDIFGAAVQFRMPFLAAKAFDFSDSYPLHIDSRQGFTYFVQLERFNDCGNHFHGGLV